MNKQQDFTDLLDDGLQPLTALEELPDFGCKWPYDNLMCCGRVRMLGRPYCETHFQRTKRQSSSVADTSQFMGNFPEPSQRKKKPRPITTLLIEDIG